MTNKKELYVKAKQGKNDFIDYINKNYKYEILDFENNQLINIYDKDSKYLGEYEFDENDNYISPIEENIGHTFTLYERLSISQKIHLSDFMIIYSIENATDKNFNQEEKERLFEVIHDAILDDETDTDRSRIADEIVNAYANNEISIEALENSNNCEILECIVGIGSFETLEEEFIEGQEDYQ